MMVKKWHPEEILIARSPQKERPSRKSLWSLQKMMTVMEKMGLLRRVEHPVQLHPNNDAEGYQHGGGRRTTNASIIV